MLYAYKYNLLDQAFQNLRFLGFSVRCSIPPTTKAIALHEWRLLTIKNIKNFENECFNNNNGDVIDRLLTSSYKREDLKASKKSKNKCKKC